jgi:hypothetical protein
VMYSTCITQIMLMRKSNNENRKRRARRVKQKNPDIGNDRQKGDKSKSDRRGRPLLLPFLLFYPLHLYPPSI